LIVKTDKDLSKVLPASFATSPSRLADRSGESSARAEVLFKFHACCRHTNPAVDGLKRVLRAHRLAARDVRRVTARVRQAAIDVLRTCSGR